MSEGDKAAPEANDEVVSAAEVKAFKKQIRQPERVLGNKNTESGNPQRSCSHWPRKKAHLAAALVRRGGFPVKWGMDVLGGPVQRLPVQPQHTASS